MSARTIGSFGLSICVVAALASTASAETAPPAAEAETPATEAVEAQPGSTEEHIEALSSVDREVRLGAVRALGEHPSPAAVPALARALRGDPDVEVRRACVRALQRSETPEARDAVATAAQYDRDEEVRQLASTECADCSEEEASPALPSPFPGVPGQPTPPSAESTPPQPSPPAGAPEQPTPPSAESAPPQPSPPAGAPGQPAPPSADGTPPQPSPFAGAPGQPTPPSSGGAPPQQVLSPTPGEFQMSVDSYAAMAEGRHRRSSRGVGLLVSGVALLVVSAIPFSFGGAMSDEWETCNWEGDTYECGHTGAYLTSVLLFSLGGAIALAGLVLTPIGAVRVGRSRSRSSATSRLASLSPFVSPTRDGNAIFGLSGIF